MSQLVRNCRDIIIVCNIFSYDFILIASPERTCRRGACGREWRFPHFYVRVLIECRWGWWSVPIRRKGPCTMKPYFSTSLNFLSGTMRDRFRSFTRSYPHPAEVVRLENCVSVLHPIGIIMLINACWHSFLWSDGAKATSPLSLLCCRPFVFTHNCRLICILVRFLWRFGWFYTDPTAALDPCDQRLAFVRPY